MKDDTTIRGLAHSETAHDSAIKHVTGRADYTDDLPEPQGLIHAYLGLSECAHGRITGMDFTDTLAHPGVLGVLTAADLPGVNDVSPNGKHDDPVFAQDHVLFWGQPVFAVIAESRDQARRAAQKAQIEYEALPFALDPIAARDAGHDYVTDPLTLRRGDARAAMATAPRRIK
ncbi:MAG: xanthine dehydrogenase molybdopterin binding subunit, partial [Paracoccus sp. (in: a-proteobacteria)]